MSKPTKIGNLIPENIEELRKIFEVKREKGVVYNDRGERSWEDKILISLALRMDEKRKAYPSVARIAQDTGYSARQVIRTLNLKQTLAPKRLDAKALKR